MSLASWITIRLSTGFLFEAEAGTSNSKNSSAFRGCETALIPNTIKTVAKTLAAMQRESDLEKLEMAK